MSRKKVTLLSFVGLIVKRGRYIDTREFLSQSQLAKIFDILLAISAPTCVRFTQFVTIYCAKTPECSAAFSEDRFHN